MMVHQALNIQFSSLCSPIPVPRSTLLICSTVQQGTTSLPLYPRHYTCLSFSVKKPKALCVNSKLTDSGKDWNPPPSSKEEAVKQVRECLSTLLEKPLKNLGASVKQKKQRQVRLRVEIPIIDDSPSALATLAGDVLGGFSAKRMGQLTKIVIFWPNSSLADLGSQIFQNFDYIKNFDFSNPDMEMEFVGDSDVLFFVAPGISELPSIESVSKEAAPRPVVLFNPNWSSEDESETNGFFSSFEAVYSFTPLAIQGFFSKSEGAIFKHVKSGPPSSSPWLIFVKVEGKYKCVSSFKRRPDASELENALYNSIALNSPLTKSIKFLRNLISRP
eukprot:Gb_25483 [translate_table: standard]